MNLSLLWRKRVNKAVETPSQDPNPKTVGPATPYLNARRNWNEHVYSVMRRALVSQILAIAGMLIGIAGLAGAISVGKESKFVPYIIEVNKLGEYQAVRRADRVRDVPEAAMKATVANFIANARLVTPDVAVQRKAIFAIYAHLSPDDPARIKMDDYLGEGLPTNPFVRAAKETVTIEQDFSPMALSDESWQVDWVETVRDRKGIPLGKSVRWRAVVSLYRVPATADTTESQLISNPFGLYVRDWSWARQP